MTWYYALNGQQQGPVSEQDLAQLASSGTLQPTTLVWRNGMAEWKPLSEAVPSALSAGAAVRSEVPQIGGYEIPAAHKDIVVQQMREGVTATVPGAKDYAGFWIRLVARVIDGVLMMVVGHFINKPFMAGAEQFAPKPGQEISLDQLMKFYAALLPAMAIGLVIGITYDVFMVWKYGGTVGKMTLGLKIMTDDGGNVSFWRAVGRYFAYIVSAMTCLIGLVIAAFDSEKRALHDHMCSTRVIKTR